ncbi:MFS transporter [Nonomuraea salmonea]|uniref:MFS transporter n=1 Tax=Nonomuraea salmonea TaxID=46181 RepID=UPI0031EE8568
MAGYDLVRAGVAAVLAAGVLPPVAMLVLVFVTGVPGAVASAARSALLPDLLDGDRYVLGRAVFSMAAGGTQVLGFAVGGMLIAAVGPYGALWITVASCLVSAALLRFRLADRPGRGPAGGSTVGRTWRVNRELLRRPEVRALLWAQWFPPALVVGGGRRGAGPVRGPRRGAGCGRVAVHRCGARHAGRGPGDRAAGRPAAERTAGGAAGAAARRAAARVRGLAGARRGGGVLLAVSGFGVAYQLGLARRFLEVVPEANRGQAFGLALTGTMTWQGLFAAGGGALGEVVTPGQVVATAGAASVVAVAGLWRVLTPRGIG